MKRLSVDQVMRMRPCSEYSEERVRELFGRRKTLSLIQILDLGIPPADRLWVMFQDNVVDDETLRRFANIVVDRAVRNHALTYEPIREWAERWLSGEDRSEKSASAADRAARWVAEDAEEWARAAASASSARAAEDWVAADAACWAEREFQVEDMRRILMEAEG